MEDEKKDKEFLKETYQQILKELKEADKNYTQFLKRRIKELEK